MPAAFHPISPTIWDRTMRQLCGPAKVVRYYVQTCPTRVSEGLFQLPLGIVVHDTGLSEVHVRQGLDQLVETGLVSYDEHAEVVLDRTALKFNPLRNGVNKTSGEVKPDNRIAGALKRFDQVPESPLKCEFVRLAREHSPDLADALVDRFGHTVERGGGSSHEVDVPAPPADQEGPSEVLDRSFEGPSKEELSRDEPTGRGTEGETVPPCGHCGKDLALITAGQVRLAGGLPWCGWCEVVA